jgi:hypothetical protein
MATPLKRAWISSFDLRQGFARRLMVRFLAKLYALVAPNYAAVIESYQKAQDVAKQTIGAAR